MVDIKNVEASGPWVVLAECVAGLAIIVLLVVLVVSDNRVLRDSYVQSVIRPPHAASGFLAGEDRAKAKGEDKPDLRGDAAKRNVAGETAE